MVRQLATLLVGIALGSSLGLQGETRTARLPGRMPDLSISPILPSVQEDSKLQSLQTEAQRAELARDVSAMKQAFVKIVSHCNGKASALYRLRLMQARLGLAVLHLQEGNAAAALTFLGEGLKEYAGDPAAELKVLALQCYWIQSTLLFDGRSWDLCLASLDSMIGLAKTAETSASRQALAAGLLLRISAFAERKDPRRLDQECRTIATEYTASEDPFILGAVCTALFNRGIALVQLNRLREALKQFEQMQERTEGVEDLGLKRIAAWSRFYQASALDMLRRKKEAKAKYAEIIQAHSGSEDPILKNICAQAQYYSNSYTK